MKRKILPILISISVTVSMVILGSKIQTIHTSLNDQNGSSSDDLFFILFGLCIAGVLIWYAIHNSIASRKNKARKKNPTGEKTYVKKEIHAEDDSPAAVTAGFLFSRMVKEGLNRYLVRDYDPVICITREDFATSAKLELKCKAVLLDILKYLDLPQIVGLSVKFSADVENGRTKVGIYSSQGYLKNINMKIEPDYTPVQVTAILCHECTHYFMEIYKLKSEVESINEQRTDILAILLGFGKIMEEGYTDWKESRVIGTEGNKKIYKTKTRKLGYITHDDCLAVSRVLKAKRKELRSENDSKEYLSEKKRKLRFLIESIERMSMMFSDSLKNTVSYSPDISQTIYDFACLDCPKKAETLKELLNEGSSLEMVISGIAEANQICENLYILIKKFA